MGKKVHYLVVTWKRIRGRWGGGRKGQNEREASQMMWEEREEEGGEEARGALELLLLHLPPALQAMALRTLSRLRGA